MEREEIRRRVASFPYWHYDFDLDGIRTNPLSPELANRHEQRKRYFFDALLELYGGSLEGKRVLDLGCNAGLWSLEAIQAGAASVVGVDGRAMHVEQANLVFEVKGVERSRYEFLEGNLFDMDLAAVGPFDVVLCLGLLYHVAKPVELIDKMASANKDVLVVDTNLSVAPGSYVRVRFENVVNPLHATEGELVVTPTKNAVVDMIRAFGYDVAVLKPRFTDYTNCRKYRHGRRKAFICSREAPLSRIAHRTEPVGRAPSAREYLWLAADNASRVPDKLRARLSRR